MQECSCEPTGPEGSKNPPPMATNDACDFSTPLPKHEPEAPVQVGSLTARTGLHSAAEQELAALRSLLFQHEITELEHLRHRLDDHATHARAVSDIIAEALLLRSNKDEKLSAALEPLVEEILKRSLRKHPKDFTSVLFPVMGPAIRRSIAEAFHGMLAGLNKSLEMSFSWKGLRWRIEAFRSGRPFSEVVLLHTLLYRVEQIFFIHSDTGLVLAHVVSEGVDTQDADMVSAMLTAIQDFARDCFMGGTQGDLDSLNLGDCTIFVERGQNAYLACVVRGTPPSDFRSKLRSSLEVMLIESADSLAAFSGDTGPFAVASRHLQDCLVSRFVNEDKPLPVWIKALPVLLVLVVFGMFGVYEYGNYEHRKVTTARLEQLEIGVTALNQEPGVVVINIKRQENGPWALFCLRDEMARPLETVLQTAGLDASQYSLRESPFLSYTHDIIARRVEGRLAPPSSVSLRLAENKTLYITGTAPMDWIMTARQEALSIPGVKDVDTAELSDPRTEKLQELTHKVESARIEFPLGKDIPLPEDRDALARAADNLVTLEKLATQMGMTTTLTIYGHADAVGTEKRNYEISQERAKTLAALLYARGSRIPIAIYGMGAEYAAKDQTGGNENQSSRRIELRVLLTRSGITGAEAIHK